MLKARYKVRYSIFSDNAEYIKDIKPFFTSVGKRVIFVLTCPNENMTSFRSEIISRGKLRIIKILNNVNVPLSDYLIFGPEGVFSMRESGRLSLTDF